MSSRPTFTASRTSSRGQPALLLFDALLVLGFGLLALGLRLPNLLFVPRFTDEQLDVLYTLPLYRLEAFPLVAWDPYNGGLFNYLLAASLWLAGPQPYVPRLLVALLGAAAVAAAYPLGKVLGGRLAGALAAGLMLTNATHVVVNSHVAWSNATTPLFTTLAFTALLGALAGGSGALLALGGLVLGLALQTHPSVVAFLPGITLAFITRQPRLLRSRAALLAVGLFLLAYSNVLAYNLLPRGADSYRQAASAALPGWGSGSASTISRLDDQRRTYGQSGPESYLPNLGRLAQDLPRLAASLIEPRAELSDSLRAPSFWIYGGLVVTGLVWPLTRGNPLPLLGGLTFLLLLPLLTGKYEPIFSGRYLMPLLPLAYAGFGGLVADLWRSTAGLVAHQQLRFGLALGAIALALYPLVPLVRYEQRTAADGRVNVDLIETAAALAAARQPDEPLLLDETLGRRNLPADGDLLQSLQVFLELRNVRYIVGPATAGRLEPQLGGARSALVVFATPYDRALEDRFRFREVETTPTSRYTAYRIERRP